MLNQRSQIDLANFACTWASNIKYQGWLQDGVQAKRAGHAETPAAPASETEPVTNAEPHIGAPTPLPARKPALPDGVPAMIEVDLGRVAGWVHADVVGANAHYLRYRVGDKTGKIPLAGRGMVWRELARGDA